ncbi:alpha/beta hydrolase [Candidatus Zinderia endosymbiont of Aphrophora alni]|uniref:alpha/beta hydrolase n=1 Tax=Candidatus Zinderia endosymbiont of Aphrophora alni TaxID=3077951 RepID=UPI0030CDACA2
MKYTNILEINNSKNIKITIICLHDLGGDKTNFLPIIKNTKIYKNINIRFIFPQSPKISISANNNIIMNAWYNVYCKKKKIEDKKGIKKSQKKIEKIINKEINRGILTKNIFLLGFSQGAVIALQTGLKYSKQLAGLISLSGYLPFKKNIKKKKIINSLNTPIFIAHGIYDNIINVKNIIKLKNFFKKNKYNFKCNLYKIKHEICKKEISDVDFWINKKILTNN